MASPLLGGLEEQLAPAAGPHWVAAPYCRNRPLSAFSQERSDFQLEALRFVRGIRQPPPIWREEGIQLVGGVCRTGSGFPARSPTSSFSKGTVQRSYAVPGFSSIWASPFPSILRTTDSENTCP